MRKAYVWAGIAAVLFAIVSLLIRFEGISGFDSGIISTVQGWENAGLTRVMEALSWFGSTMVVIVIAIVILLFLAFVLGHRMELLFFISALAGSSLLNHLLKDFFQRERPNIHRLVEETGYSFPSGHSMAAFALYGAFVYLLWKRVKSGRGRALLVALGAILVVGIGISRIYLGVHYPSDVAGGYLASWVWLGLMIEVFRKLAPAAFRK
ncbi:phosphatase PAP2 family protein [Cohnella cholangitidis]|uniref:Phosphatase PAP2 family protein n=1 Tax=Cohnella cholangitidis TaxID=2598458 RepID=A0A7G5C7D0_9BACL|nr:phosphatase PAP2 family protein [Cohnella cholangitidis]